MGRNGTTNIEKIRSKVKPTHFFQLGLLIGGDFENYYSRNFIKNNTWTSNAIILIEMLKCISGST